MVFVTFQLQTKLHYLLSLVYILLQVLLNDYFYIMFVIGHLLVKTSLLALIMTKTKKLKYILLDLDKVWVDLQFQKHSCRQLTSNNYV